MNLGTDWIEQSRGDSLNFCITYTTAAGVAIDITNCTVKLDIGGLIDESDAGVTISTPDSTGIINIVVTDTAMAVLVDAEYIMRIALVYPDLVRETIDRRVLRLID